MKNTKKIIAALAVSISIFGAVPAFATIVGSGQIPLFYAYGHAGGYDSYVKASVSGTMFEDHHYSNYTPTAFKALLGLRTPWYTPNVIKDASYNPDGWNKANDVIKGQEFRTTVEADGVTGNRTDIFTEYDNY